MAVERIHIPSILREPAITNICALNSYPEAQTVCYLVTKLNGILLAQRVAVILPRKLVFHWYNLRPLVTFTAVRFYFQLQIVWIFHNFSGKVKPPDTVVEQY